MKTFFQTHKWIGWLVLVLGLIFSYLSSSTAAHMLLVAGGALVYVTHAAAIGTLLRNARQGGAARKKAVVIGVIGVVAIAFAVTNGYDTDRRRDAISAQRQGTASSASTSNTANTPYGYRAPTESELKIGALLAKYGDGTTTERDTSPADAGKPRTQCVACGGTGICAICDGTGYYSNYGIRSECSACDNGRCSICDGVGYY